MSVKLVNDDSLTDVADAIRIKGEISGTLEFPDGFISAIQAIPTGGITPSGTYSITSNGIYDIVSFASVDVNVSGGGGGDHDAEDGIIDKTISGAYENSRVTRIGVQTFASCAGLTTVSFPNVTTIGSSAFYNCASLTTVNFPNVTTIWSYVFYSCASLTTASFPNATKFGNQCFRYCNHLESLYILASSVATLGPSAFASTPMSLSSYLGHFGSIYVPASLVSAYKVATNWSGYKDRITSYTG